MPRSKINETISLANTGAAINGAHVLVTGRDGVESVVYADDIGSSVLTQPLSTDIAGRIPGWVDNGSYVLEVTPAPGRPYFVIGPIYVEIVNGTGSSSGGGSLGNGSLIVGPSLPVLQSGTEYVWNKTDGQGHLLDIRSGVAV